MNSSNKVLQPFYKQFFVDILAAHVESRNGAPSTSPFLKNKLG
jgi:hypothetical protein